MMARRAWAVVGAVCVFALGTPGLAQPQDETGHIGVTAVGPWGDAAADLNLGWEQLTVSWADVQPEPDTFAFDTLDEQVQRVTDAGREVVGHIVQTPAWASAAGTPAAVPDGLALPADDPANVWGAFVTALADRYAPLGVHDWVIYTTPNVRRGEGMVTFDGAAADYARLLATASAAARAIDPQARIHVAAPDWGVDQAAGRGPFLARLIAAIPAGEPLPFDVVRVRVLNQTDAVTRQLENARAILDAAGLDTPIWLEANAIPTLDLPLEGSLPVFGISARQQADFIIQAAVLAEVTGAARVLIAPFADDPAVGVRGGVLRADGTPRPAYAALQQVSEWLDGVTAVERHSHELAELIVLERSEQDVYMMWARTEQPVRVLITAEAPGEEARLYAERVRTTVRAGPEVFPAIYTVDAPGAQRDANGFLTVAGSPRVLVVPATDFYRVGYLERDGDRIRIR